MDAAILGLAAALPAFAARLLGQRPVDRLLQHAFAERDRQGPADARVVDRQFSISCGSGLALDRRDADIALILVLQRLPTGQARAGLFDEGPRRGEKDGQFQRIAGIDPDGNRHAADVLAHEVVDLFLLDFGQFIPKRIVVGIDRDRRSDPAQRDRLPHVGGKTLAHAEQRRIVIQCEDELRQGFVRIAGIGCELPPSEISANWLYSLARIKGMIVRSAASFCLPRLIRRPMGSKAQFQFRW